MTKLSQLKIDPEFQNQINPPSFEETHQLEMNILKRRTCTESDHHVERLYCGFPKTPRIITAKMVCFTAENVTPQKKRSFQKTSL